MTLTFFCNNSEFIFVIFDIMHYKILNSENKKESSPDPYIPKNPCPLDLFPPKLRRPCEAYSLPPSSKPLTLRFTTRVLRLRSSRIALLKKCWSVTRYASGGHHTRGSQGQHALRAVVRLQQVLVLKVLVTS